MSDTLERIQKLAIAGKLRISSHGYERLVEEGILFAEVRDGLEKAIVVEDYPKYAKGPCVLVLQNDTSMRPLHVLWGIAREASEPGVLITGYRPDPNRWTNDFLRRKA